MKKVLFVAAIALFSVSVLVTSCDEDNPVSCTQKLIDVTEAASDYSSDPSTANCESYKDALQDYIDCDGIADKAYYTTILQALPCY